MIAIRKLVTAADVKAWSDAGRRTVTVSENTIITPAAWDEAKDYGLSIVFGSEPPAAKSSEVETNQQVISQIVEQVIAALTSSPARDQAEPERRYAALALAPRV